MNITKDIVYVGVNDRDIDLFEGQYVVPNGMSYNSYVIFDEKIAVMDTVDARFGDAWIENLKRALGTRNPSYLIVQHMEPDHSANIVRFAEEFPEATVIASDRSLVMMKQFFGDKCPARTLAVKDGEHFSLGEHELTFIHAPMVHWPEVMVTYDATDKVLFSADAFGKFGALDADEDWACEARRYYFGIVGKYGAQVQKLLSRVGELDIHKICSLHGPILEENLGYYIGLYDIWSKYEVESDGIVIAYTSVYGNTKKAVELLEAELVAAGCPHVVVNDLARCDMAEAVEDAFRYGTLVLASTTYNGGMFPFMREFLEELTERGYCKRKIAIIENGTWAPTVQRHIKQMLEGSKEITFVEPAVTIRSAMTEQNKAEIAHLAAELCR